MAQPALSLINPLHSVLFWPFVCWSNIQRCCGSTWSRFKLTYSYSSGESRIWVERAPCAQYEQPYGRKKSLIPGAVWNVTWLCSLSCTPSIISTSPVLRNIEMEFPALDVIYLHMASFLPLVSKMLAKLLEKDESLECNRLDLLHFTTPPRSLVQIENK